MRNSLFILMIFIMIMLIVLVLYVVNNVITSYKADLKQHGVESPHKQESLFDHFQTKLSKFS